jgi:signal transduction histidine kinase
MLLLSSITTNYFLSASINGQIIKTEKDKFILLRKSFKTEENISNFYSSLFQYYNEDVYYPVVQKDGKVVKSYNELLYRDVTDFSGYLYLSAKREDYLLNVYIDIEKMAKPFVDTSTNIVNFILVIFTLLNIFLGLYWLKNYLTPLSNISRNVKDLELGDRINVPKTDDEFSELALEFNTMIDKLEYSIVKEKQFISDVSHELKTPLTVLQGYLKLLKKNQNPEFIDEYIKVCSEEQLRMINLTRVLLDLYKIEKSSVVKEPVDIGFILTNIVEVYNNINEEFEINLILEENDFVMGNASHIEQIVYILLDNAIKYSQDNKKIEVHYADDRLEVRDYGIGMDEKALNKIFDRFFRVEQSRSFAKKGYGIGLSILNEICNKYDYKIEVMSKPGVGSVFIIDFEGV